MNAGRAGRKLSRRAPIGPSSQIKHHQADTIVRDRTWNKMEQNGALFDRF